jgi:hypothetical protein
MVPTVSGIPKREALSPRIAENKEIKKESFGCDCEVVDIGLGSDSHDRK